MPCYENLNLFTIGGPEAAKLATTITRVTHTQVQYSDSCWCYKDYGVNHFNLGVGIEHDFDFRLTATNRAGCGGGACMYNALWALSNTINDLYSTDPFLSVSASTHNATVKYAITSWEHNVGWWNDGGTGYIFDIGTTYYAKIRITGVAYVLDIYSTSNLRDAGANGDLSHKTIVLQSAVYQYRYLYGFNSWDFATGGPWTSGWGENYDIHEIIAPTVQTDLATNCAVDGLSIQLNGQITATGGRNATVRGFRWGLVFGGPYPNDWNEVGDFGVGAFNRTIVINCDVNYFYQAYAVNCRGTTYGLEQTFLCPCPVLECADYDNQIDCEANGCCWYNGTCYDCDEVPCGYWTNQVDCEANDCCWCDGVCQDCPCPEPPIPPPPPPPILCSDYTTQTECEANGCCWCNEICQDCPCPPPPEVCVQWSHRVCESRIRRRRPYRRGNHPSMRRH